MRILHLSVGKLSFKEIFNGDKTFYLADFTTKSCERWGYSKTGGFSRRYNVAKLTDSMDGYGMFYIQLKSISVVVVDYKEKFKIEFGELVQIENIRRKNAKQYC